MSSVFSFSAALVLALLCVAATSFPAENAALSEDSETCLACHATLNPGIVADWRKGLHARVTPAEALKKDDLERRISVAKVPENLANVAVGCAECHNLNPEKHKDTFEHADYKVHVVVTPNDCATCHAVEVKEYGQNLMSHAYGNLKNNPVYHSLVNSATGVQSFENMTTSLSPPDAETEADSCFYCHGTAVEEEVLRQGRRFWGRWSSRFFPGGRIRELVG